MACGDCKCENPLEFNCGGIVQPDFTIGSCIYPDAFSLDLNITSKSDCIFYKTECQASTEFAASQGVVDCYDRQTVLDNEINGTYILTRVGPPNQFNYAYNPGPDNNKEFITNGCIDYGRQYDHHLYITMNGLRCAKRPTPQNEQQQNYNSNGTTATLVIDYPSRDLMPSMWPPFYIGHVFNNGVQTLTSSFRNSLLYGSNQVPPCSGSMSFTFSAAGNGFFFGPSDILGRNTEFNVFQAAITVNPV